MALFTKTRKRIAGWGAIVALLIALVPTHPQRSMAADGLDLKFIRDAEIESYLRQLATPVFRAADLDPDAVSLNIIESRTVNAFVAGGMNIFLYTGLLQLTDTPEQLLGVIAHESGHISGGHLIRGQEGMRNASRQAILGMIIGLAAGIAAKSGQAAAGAISAGQQLGERSFLSFSRTQESSADAAGMSFLDGAGVTTRGMREFFEKLKGQEMMPVERQSEYIRTHPLTENRIEAVQNHLNNSSLKNAKLDASFYEKHERMKAKLLGYLQPETAKLRYTEKDPRINARYSLAIAFYRTSAIEKALAMTSGLIKQEPRNPFFHELKGQILFENGRINEALSSFKTANDLLPGNALLENAYGHALLESRDPANLDRAIKQLEDAARIEKDVPSTWRLLAQAWGRKAEASKNKSMEGLVSYALAEEAMARGADAEAGQYAERAIKTLEKNTPYWLRAQDIKLSAENAANTRH